jgi:hypothetical protein
LRAGVVADIEFRHSNAGRAPKTCFLATHGHALDSAALRLHQMLQIVGLLFFNWDKDFLDARLEDDQYVEFMTSRSLSAVGAMLGKELNRQHR